MANGGWRTGTKGKLKARFAAVPSAPPMGHRSGSGIRASNIYRAMKPGLSANTAAQAKRMLSRQSACCDRSAHFGCHHQGTLDLRASPSAAERGAWARPLRRAILARTSPPCAHDDDRLRLPPIPSPPTSEAGKKKSTDHRLDQACRPSVTPSSRSSPDRHRSDAHTAENRSARARSVNKSAKVVLGRALIKSRAVVASRSMSASAHFPELESDIYEVREGPNSKMKEAVK